MSQHFAGVLGQQTQELVFNRRQVDLYAVAVGAAGSVVDFQSAVFVNAGCLAGAFIVIAHAAQSDRTRANSSSTEKGLVR